MIKTNRHFDAGILENPQADQSSKFGIGVLVAILCAGNAYLDSKLRHASMGMPDMVPSLVSNWRLSPHDS